MNDYGDLMEPEPDPRAAAAMHARLVCMAMDAMRLCLGGSPRNFAPKQIAAFVRRRAAMETEGRGR